MNSLEHRPYLNEGAVGNEFQPAAFLALLLCIGVVGAWVYSARGLFGDFFGWVSGESPVAAVQVETTQYTDVSPYAAGPAAPASGREEHAGAPAPSRVWTPSSDCVVEVAPCTIEVVMAAQEESGCLAVCQ